MDEVTLMTQRERKPDVDEVRRFLREAEGSTVEFKTQLRDPAHMARLIAAFANAMGGSILVGISDTAAVVGASVAAVANILEEARKHLHPSVPASLHEVNVDGKPVAIVQVPPSETPVASDGSFFVRTGATVRAMLPDDLVRKLSEASQPVGIAELARSISKQTETIEVLERQLAKANSLRSKLQDYIVGGGIGAILGFLLSLVVT